MRGCIRPISALVPMLAAVAAVQGCAAIPIAVIAGSLLEAGGGVLVKTGTEYSSSGTARRTFNAPLADVHAAVLETFRRSQIPVTRDQATEAQQVVTGAMRGRKVRVRLVPLTPALTSMELAVKRNIFAGDKATASELLAQTEQVLTSPPGSARVEAAPTPTWTPATRRRGN